MALPNIPSGTWFELQNTTFRAYANANGPPASMQFGGNGRGTMFLAWNSGLVDRSRKQWVIMRPGGHADTPINGVYAFSWDTLQWSTLRPHYNPCALDYGSPGYPPLAGDSNNLYTPSRLSVYSNDPTDNRTVTINGENVAGTPVVETVQINGTTPTLTTTTFRWVVNIQMSGPNITGNVRVAYIRREDETIGVWPTTKGALNSTATGTSRISGPFNNLHEDKLLGSTAYYLQTPTVPNLNEPASVHTYDSIEYLVAHDRYYSGGGRYHSTAGDSSPATVWIFNPNTATWSLPSPGSTNRPGAASSCTLWDPDINLLWVRVPSEGLFTYNWPTNTWTQRHSGTAGGVQNSKFVLDRENRDLYLVMPTSGTSVTLYKYDISNINSVTQVPIPVTGTIDVRKAGVSQSIEGIGAVWIGDRIAVFGRDSTGTQGAVYSTSPSNPVWQIHEPPDGVKPPIMENTGGVWNKFFSPDDIHLMRYYEESKNWWVYKVPWSTATPFRPTSLTARLK